MINRGIIALFLSLFLVPRLAQAQFEGEDSPSYSAPASPGLLTHLDGSEISTGQKYLFGASAVATYYLISQVKNGPLIFGGLYAMATLVLMRESTFQFAQEPSELVVPFSLVAMSILNIALFNNNTDRFSYNDVFFYNVGATALIAGYAWWDQSKRTRGGHVRASSFISPMIGRDRAGLVWSSTFFN